MAMQSDYLPGQQHPQEETHRKEILVLIAGAGDRPENYHPVEVVPGNRAIDILLVLNLVPGHQLKKPGAGFFAANEDIYPAVIDGQKVYAHKTNVEAGTLCGALFSR